MFTGRSNTLRYCFRLSVLTRAGLTMFPWINPAPCERRTIYCYLPIVRLLLAGLHIRLLVVLLRYLIL